MKVVIESYNEAFQEYTGTTLKTGKKVLIDPYCSADENGDEYTLKNLDKLNVVGKLFKLKNKTQKCPIWRDEKEIQVYLPNPNQFYPLYNN